MPSSVQLLQLAAKDKVNLMISESSLANLIYLSFDIYKIKDAALKLSDLISVCELAHAGKNGALLALNSQFKDKEDALQYFTALHAKANYFVTRNIKDYRHGWSSLPVFTPDDFIKEIT